MKITAVVLHYNRPENVRRWIDGIRSQTVESEIIVWDNSGNYPKGSGEDVLISSSKNYFCLPRWLVCGLVTSEYCYIQDDDKALTDSGFFARMVGIMPEHPNTVFGWKGRKFCKDMDWERPYSFPGNKETFIDIDPESGRDADVLNLGVSFFGTETINNIPINPFVGGEISEYEYSHADDIYVSNNFLEKREFPFDIQKCFDSLPEPCALSKQSDHMGIRDTVCRRLWEKYYR